MRDREVLAAYLLEHGQPEAAHWRMAQMAQAYPAVAASPELAQLMMIFDAFPRFLRASQRQGLLKGLRKRIEKRLGKQWKKLDVALHDPAHDRHRLRLLIKRVRYGIEAYPELDRLPKAALARLKSAQSALGDWHDSWQWLARAVEEPDLLPCVAVWKTTMANAESPRRPRSRQTQRHLLQILKSPQIKCRSEPAREGGRVIQHLCRLTRRIREQARSYMDLC